MMKLYDYKICSNCNTYIVLLCCAVYCFVYIHICMYLYQPTNSRLVYICRLNKQNNEISSISKYMNYNYITI